MALNWAGKFRIDFYSIWFLWALCLIFNIITFLLVYFKIHTGDRILALHYNVLVGVEWYGSGRNLYFLPGTGLLLTGANFVLYKKLQTNEDFLSSLAVFVSLSAQIILLLAALLLSRIN